LGEFSIAPPAEMKVVGQSPTVVVVGVAESHQVPIADWQKSYAGFHVRLTSTFHLERHFL
jgi:uncharacterized protein YaiE (UPF0345 family)